MMFVSLLLALAALGGAQATEVKITYNPPVTRFSLSDYDKGIGGVTFHYTFKNVMYRGKGTQTSEGWEYRTRDISLDGADTLFAYAQVYDTQGKLQSTTSRTSYTLGDTNQVAALPSRRIRGAAFFRDDFNTFNGANWDYEISMFGGYNNEFQVYCNDPKNVYIQNGGLYLRPTPTTDDPRFDENFLHTGVMDMTQLFGYCTYSDLNGCTRDGHNGILPVIMSGKVMSVPTIKYGEVEVRARIPKGDWLWPAIWLLPKYSVYGYSPKSGEIDMMETIGNVGDYGISTVYSTLHWGPDGDHNGFQLTTGNVKAQSGTWHDGFHTWRVEWTTDHIATFVDNQQLVYTDGNFWQKGGFTGTNIWAGGEYMAPFDQEFYLILNVAVGGTSGMFPDSNIYNGVTKPWRNTSPTPMEDFWNNRNQWLPSWQGDETALIVDYVEFRNP